MTKKDESLKNVSNISISKECYKKLKMLSIDMEMTLQEVCAEVLEESMLKNKKVEEAIKVVNMK